jgi:hypothetical protein
MKPDVNSEFLGDVQRLRNGNTLITFSTGGFIHEVSPSGASFWIDDLAFYVRRGFGRTVRFISKERGLWIGGFPSITIVESRSHHCNERFPAY